MILPVLLAAAVAAAPPTKDAALFAAVEQFCLNTEGRGADALAAAETAGWQYQTKEAAEKMFGPGVDPGQVRVSLEPPLAQFLFVRSFNRPLNGDQLTVSECNVLGGPLTPEEMAAFQNTIATWAGVVAQPYSDGQLYVFMDTPSGHRPPDPKWTADQTRSALRAGRIINLYVRGKGSLATVSYSKPKAAVN